MRKSFKITGAAVTFGAVAFFAMLISAPRGQAQGNSRNNANSSSSAGSSNSSSNPNTSNPTAISEDESRIKRGLEIAPVALTMNGKNRALVGLGSYIVNAQGGCNDCHTVPNYTSDPFSGQPKVVNAAKYLGGGRPFFGPVISRNLTPDKTGKPLGGADYDEFVSIMRTGVDPDTAHPQFGPLLQVMPWPVYQDMTDHDLRAIYEYLSAIPCVEGEPGLPNPRPIGQRCQ